MIESTQDAIVFHDTMPSPQAKYNRLARIQGYLFAKALRPGFHPITEQMHEDVECVMLDLQRRGAVWNSDAKMMYYVGECMGEGK